MKTLTFSLGPPLSLSPTTTAIPRAPDTALCSSPHPPRPCCSSHYRHHADQMPRQTKSPSEKSEATQASASMTRQSETPRMMGVTLFPLRRDEVPRGFFNEDAGSRNIVLFACFVPFLFFQLGGPH